MDGLQFTGMELLAVVAVILIVIAAIEDWSGHAL